MSCGQKKKVKHTILALCGNGNSGKSTTLLKMIKYLDEDIGFSKVKEETCGKDNKEKTAVYIYKGVSIAVHTRGDTDDELNRGYNKAQEINKEKVDIFVCSCKSSGKSYKWAEDRKAIFIDLISLDKFKWSIANDLHDKQAKLIIDEVIKLID